MTIHEIEKIAAQLGLPVVYPDGTVAAPPLRRTPFARIFPETNTPHRFEKGHEWNELPICTRCGCMEGALLATCPIQTLTFAETEIAYKAFCEVSAKSREVIDRCKELEMEYPSDLPWKATISDYNDRARVFNDNLIDLTTNQRREKGEITPSHDESR